MSYTTKSLPYRIIMTGIVAILIASFLFICIIIIASYTSLRGEGEGAAILIAILWVYGSKITVIHLIIGIIFLMLHIGHRKNKYGQKYLWALFIVSILAIASSAGFLIVLFMKLNGFPANAFVKLLIASVSLGIILPYSFIVCGCIINLFQRITKKQLETSK